MSECDGPPGEDSQIWPPPNFDCWPETRYAGIAFAGVSIILFVIPQMWRHYRNCILWNVFGGPFFFGLWLGLAIHFIPCIWWSCDWGFYDGQAVRGGIWFGVWIGAYIGFTIYVCRHNKKQKEIAEQELAQDFRAKGIVKGQSDNLTIVFLK